MGFEVKHIGCISPFFSNGALCISICCREKCESDGDYKALQKLARDPHFKTNGKDHEYMAKAGRSPVLLIASAGPENQQHVGNLPKVSDAVGSAVG